MRVHLREGELVRLIETAVDGRVLNIGFGPSGAWVDSDRAANWVMMMIAQMRQENDKEPPSQPPQSP